MGKAEWDILQYVKLACCQMTWITWWPMTARAKQAEIMRLSKVTKVFNPKYEVQRMVQSTAVSLTAAVSRWPLELVNHTSGHHLSSSLPSFVCLLLLFSLSASSFLPIYLPIPLSPTKPGLISKSLPCVHVCPTRAQRDFISALNMLFMTPSCCSGQPWALQLVKNRLCVVNKTSKYF